MERIVSRALSFFRDNFMLFTFEIVSILESMQLSVLPPMPLQKKKQKCPFCSQQNSNVASCDGVGGINNPKCVHRPNLDSLPKDLTAMWGVSDLSIIAEYCFSYKIIIPGTSQSDFYEIKVLKNGTNQFFNKMKTKKIVVINLKKSVKMCFLST